MVGYLDSEAAKAALLTAKSEIDEVVQSFKKTSEDVFNQLSEKGGAMGGNVGNMANASFENNSRVAFDDLNAKLQSFTSRVDEILERSVSATSSATEFYGK